MKEKYKVNLLEGRIGMNLLKLSIPVILSSLVFLIYALTDIKFISYYIGDSGVNSVAAATFFGNVGGALMTIPSVGSQVLISQMIGAKNDNLMRKYAVSGIQVAIIIGVTFGTLCLFLAPNFINLLGISKDLYFSQSVIYLRINSIGFIFFFVVITLSSIVSADGDTIGPLIFVLIGIVLNIILDYVFLGILKFGISGTAIASTISILIGLVLFVIYFNRKNSKFKHLKIFAFNKYHIYKSIFKIGLPASAGQLLFSLVSIQIGTVITRLDQSILGVQRLGIQFEALSWSMAGGVSSALSTFVGQNYGAKQFNRLKIGVIKTSVCMFIIGIIITIIFITKGGQMYSMFLSQPRLIKEGMKYITIIGISQAFQSLDIIITGGFNGMGQTRIPLYVGSVFKILRIPSVYIIVPFYGLIGIWWVISINTILQSIFMTISFIYYFKNVRKKESVI